MHRRQRDVRQRAPRPRPPRPDENLLTEADARELIRTNTPVPAALRLPEGWKTNAILVPVAPRLSGQERVDYINHCYENMPFERRHLHPQDPLSSRYWDEQVELEYMGRLMSHRTNSDEHSNGTQSSGETYPPSEQEEEDSSQTEWHPLITPHEPAQPANAFFLPCNCAICSWAHAQPGTCPNCGSE